MDQLGYNKLKIVEKNDQDVDDDADGDENEDLAGPSRVCDI